MSRPITIRSAAADDIPAITRIYNHAILHTNATFDTEPKSIDERTEWFNAHRDAFPVVVAECEGRVVGWASLSPYRTRAAYRFTVENAIYIDQDSQGRGAGSLLLDRLLLLAKDLGYHVMLAVITGGNDVSIRLHRRFGFAEVGVLHEVGWKADQWLDVVFMQRMIE